MHATIVDAYMVMITGLMISIAYNLLLYKAEKPSVRLSVRPSASRDNLSGFCMDRLGTWFVHR